MSTFLNPVPCAWPARQGLEPRSLIPNLQTENERDVSHPARIPQQHNHRQVWPRAPTSGLRCRLARGRAVSTPPGQQRDPQQWSHQQDRCLTRQCFWAMDICRADSLVSVPSALCSQKPCTASVRREPDPRPALLHGLRCGHLDDLGRNHWKINYPDNCLILNFPL